MFYRISNTAERWEIEEVFDRKFEFPNLYQPQVLINGLSETTLPLITSEQSEKISYGIWGILPQNFEDEWDYLQGVQNTLNINVDEVNTNSFFSKAFKKRRCAIIITGFFVHHIKDGVLYPYYVRLKTKKPFPVAGIYNTLADNFITTSLLLTDIIPELKNIQSLNNKMPLILDSKTLDLWVNPFISYDVVKDILRQDVKQRFEIFPIAKSFYKRGITYKDMLKPVYYKGIPMF